MFLFHINISLPLSLSFPSPLSKVNEHSRMRVKKYEKKNPTNGRIHYLILYKKMFVNPTPDVSKSLKLKFTLFVLQICYIHDLISSGAVSNINLKVLI